MTLCSVDIYMYIKQLIIKKVYKAKKAIKPKKQLIIKKVIIHF